MRQGVQRNPAQYINATVPYVILTPLATVHAGQSHKHPNLFSRKITIRADGKDDINLLLRF